MAPPSSTALRILCLHDGNSTAAELKEQFHLLGEKLFEKHAIDLVYVNSPITVASRTEQEAFVGSEAGEPIRRVWWEEVADRSNDPRENGTSESPLDITPDENLEHAELCETSSTQHDPHCYYRGLDASLMLLRQIWTSCPFWGILGVGQGAAVAALLLAVLESEGMQAAAAASHEQGGGGLPPRRTFATPLPPQFAVFVSGESLVPVDEPLLLESEDLAILHLVDCNITPQQERLIRQFPWGATEHRRAIGATESIIDSYDLNTIGRFVCERKKELFGATSNGDSSHSLTSSPRQILALQTALHLAEQDAADCIAETIALNPPAALMAVIRPQAVAGWKGNRRRQAGEEGGGAPCPSEFLLHQQERARNAAGAGARRVHPKNQAGPQTDK